MKDFEELISKDEALTAKAKEITGEGEKKKKITAFAASLGYELVPNGLREMNLEELEQIAGGPRTYNCEHEFVFVDRVQGKTWGWNRIERCRKCGYERSVWD